MILIAEWDLDLARMAARIPEQSAQILRGRIMGSGMWQHGLSVSACAFSMPRGSRFWRRVGAVSKLCPALTGRRAGSGTATKRWGRVIA
jgi:hypothetical protein